MSRARPKMTATLGVLGALVAGAGYGQNAALEQPPNTWVKRSPLPGGPTSPRLGYEGACVWDSKHHVLIRYGGHNQGGGGEQHAETWLFDLRTARWTLTEPNTLPPGICCGQQNVFDPAQGRYLRFPAFSGSHHGAPVAYGRHAELHGPVGGRIGSAVAAPTGRGVGVGSATPLRQLAGGEPSTGGGRRHS